MSAAANLSVPASQSLPFRLESGAPAAEGAGAQTDAIAEPASPANAAPEAETSVVLQGADVTIGLDSDQRLDVTIATASRQAADRIEAARADLQRDLTALGAEVEAIRVEVRSERAPDGSGQGAASPANGAPHGQGERQGHAMRNRNDQQAEHPNGQSAPAAGLSGSLRIRIGGNTTIGRVDRYA